MTLCGAHLQTLFQERREKGAGDRVLFADLIKIYDRTQHNVIQKPLELTGDPLDVIKWTMNSCSNFQVVLKFSKEEIEIPCSCSFHQEYC